jgi:Flp pilus assembly pilin Flp
MDRQTFFGGSALGVTIRLALISIAVGIVMKALGITLSNFFDRINALMETLYDLGFGAFEWILEYLLLGALVVIPIWLIARLVNAARESRKNHTPAP